MTSAFLLPDPPAGQANDALPSREIGYPRLFAITFLTYLVTGYVGLHIQSVNTFATLIWPPSGIAFAAFLLYGYRMWPGVFLAAFLVNASIGAPLPIAFCIALGNTLGPLAGASLMKWYSSYDPKTLQLRDNVGIIVNAIMVAAVTATVGVGSLWAGDLIPAGAFKTTWGTWWTGDALGILVCAPFILKWFNRPLSYRKVVHYVELAAVEITVVASALLIFWSPYTPFSYVLFIPLTWVGLRTGPRGITLALLLSAAIAIPGTILGHGPFAELGLQNLQIFLATMSVVFLVFTAVVEERKNVLQTLKQHVDELENALYRINSEDEARKEFLAVLAHELRNPLATILSSIELIRLQGSSAVNTNMLLETIVERAHAMVHLLDDLLDISRISQKKLSLQKKTVAVDTFIDKLSVSTQLLISKYGHVLSVTRPEEELYIDADLVRLEQIFTNLLVNAAKYTKTPGSIDIIVKHEKDTVVISVRDSGIGIPKNMLRRIFEPFFQINRGQSSNEGVGIGLPLTRQLVEMHGGTIEARSEGANAGSEFIVRLPLLRHAPRTGELPPPPAIISPKAPQRAPRKPRQVKRTFRILVVDDNREGSEALARMLELRGHRIAVAFSGLEGLEKAPQFNPEIVLLDIGLPDIDGYEVASRLHKEKNVPVLIALTGYGQPDDKERARQARFDYHLTKPAGLKDIEAILRKLPSTIGSAAK